MIFFFDLEVWTTLGWFKSYLSDNFVHVNISSLSKKARHGFLSFATKRSSDVIWKLL